MAQAAKSGVLSQAEAVAFANKLGMTLPEAVKAGYLSPAQVPGTYVITERGAGAVGVPVVGGMSALQITALVAGIVGLTVVIIDFVDDDGDNQGGPGPTPTPTPAPTATPTGGPGTTSTGPTLPPTPTPVVTATPAPTGNPGGGNTTSNTTATQ